MTSEERQSLWATRISDYRASGERAAAWCERHQVTRDQLWYWMRKLKQTPNQGPVGQPQWTRLGLAEPADSDAGTSILVRVGAAAIEVRVLQSLC